MIRIRLRWVGLIALLMMTHPAAADEIGAVRAVIDAYAAALNSEAVEGVMAVYASDAVFVPNRRPSAAGHETIRKAYHTGFDTFDYDLTFRHHESEVFGSWAWARTSSQGTLTPREPNSPVRHVKSRELFLLKRQTDGGWKIIRYLFNAAPMAAR